jgi:hypothetical protein
MNRSEQSVDRESGSRGALFVKGFLLRLLYGAIGLPLICMIRPDFLDERKREALTFAASAYLVVCLAGAIYDAVLGPRQRESGRGTRLVRNLVLMALLVALLLWGKR